MVDRVFVNSSVSLVSLVLFAAIVGSLLGILITGRSAGVRARPVYPGMPAGADMPASHLGPDAHHAWSASLSPRRGWALAGYLSWRTQRSTWARATRIGPWSTAEPGMTSFLIDPEEPT
jgi:hypothetical protein